MRFSTSNWSQLVEPRDGDWLQGLERLSRGAKKNPFTIPRVLVVDDDPTFCKVMSRTAKKLKIRITTCETLEKLTRLPDRPPYDVIVVDYYFGSLTGTQLSYLLGKHVPVVMTCGTERHRIPDTEWPPCVLYFIHKLQGPEAILTEALKSVGVETEEEKSHQQTANWLALGFFFLFLVAFVLWLIKFP